MWRLLLISLFAIAAFADDGPGPQGGHSTMRVGIDGGTNESVGTFVGLSYRFGLHDFLDRQNEYPDDTSIEFAGFRLEVYPNPNRVLLDEITLLKVVRLPALTGAWQELSWKVEVGARGVREPLCNRCGAGGLLGGLGGTVKPFENFPLAITLLLEAEVLASPNFTGFPAKPSVGPRLGIRMGIKPWLNGWVYGLYRYLFALETQQILEFGTEWRLALGRNWALNLRASRLGDGWTAHGGFFAYF